MTQPELPYLLSAYEVAAWLLLTERRILRMAKAGELPCVQLPDGNVMFEKPALLEWLALQRRPRRERGTV